MAKRKSDFQVELAETLGADEMTTVNWKIRGMVPQIRSVKERLSQQVEGTEIFLYKNTQHG